MKGNYDGKHYKKAPSVFRNVMCDSWDDYDMVVPKSSSSQSGQFPRGCGIRFSHMPRQQERNRIHCG